MQTATALKVFTLDELRSFNPCYDPGKYLPDNWEGTAIDILNVTDCPAKDRIWVVLRHEFLSDKDLRLFAVWCARQVLAIPGNESEVCSDTCDVAERFAIGESTNDELAAAWDAASAATCAAAKAATCAATCAAAWAAAWAAASAATCAATCAAAWAAAWDAAKAAAWAAAWDAQIERLKDVFQSL